jgi:hypothetical protein
MVGVEKAKALATAFEDDRPHGGVGLGGAALPVGEPAGNDANPQMVERDREAPVARQRLRVEIRQPAAGPDELDARSQPGYFDVWPEARATQAAGPGAARAHDRAITPPVAVAAAYRLLRVPRTVRIRFIGGTFITC